jgi:hypothetical protein
LNNRNVLYRGHHRKTTGTFYRESQRRTTGKFYRGHHRGTTGLLKGARRKTKTV